MLDTEWGQPVDPDQVAQALDQNPDAVAVLGTLSETSTGTGHPVEAIGRIVARTPALFAVDGISGVGAMECRTDAWGIDLLCVGSQKALMLPPGLAFVSVSPKAWAKIDAFDSHSYYFNLKAARKKIKESDTPYTPAHTLILALRTALRRIKDEGLENVWQRHRRMSEACQAGVQALGLELFSTRPAEGLTAFRVPAGLKESQIRNALTERFGITTVGGQEKLKGTIIRIGHMGYTDELDVISTLAALEMTLADLGYDVEPGRAITAAQQVLIGQGRALSRPDRGEQAVTVKKSDRTRSSGPESSFEGRIGSLIAASPTSDRSLDGDASCSGDGQAGRRGAGRLRAEPGIEVVVNTKLAAGSRGVARRHSMEADGIAIRSGTQLTADVLEGQTRLKAIVPRRRRRGQYRRRGRQPRRGIVVMNTPGGNTISTAEHTMALLLSLARNVPKANDSLKAGKWERTKFTGTQLEGQDTGGDRPGERRAGGRPPAQGFGMTVVGFDPFLAADKALELRRRERGAARRHLGPLRLFTLHTPMTAETRNLIGAARDRPHEARRSGSSTAPRRPDRRGCTGRSPHQRQGRRRGDRRFRARAAAGRPSAGRSSPGRGDAPPRRLHRGSPGLGRRRSRPAPERLPDPRAGAIRRQHADS